MKSDHAHLLVLVAVTSGVSVLAVILTALISVAIVQAVKSFFIVVVQLISFVLEVLVAVVAAITSGTTITLSIVTASLSSAVTFPASSIRARIGQSMVVSSSAIFGCSVIVLRFTSLRVGSEIAVAIIGGAVVSVAFAAAWAVGVMSLIEKETRHVGLEVISISDTVRRNNYRILRVLLALHSKSKKRQLDAALQHAVKAGFPECTKVLLAAGANPDVRDLYDNTPLMTACETGSYEIAKVLVENGASVGLQHLGGRGTALHQAANWGSDECIRLLLSKSADPNTLDGQMRTPLMLAAMHAHATEIVLPTLISAGSDVNARGPDRKTALHFAAARGIDINPLLIAGADPEVADSMGNTAFHLGAAAGHDSVVRTLLNDGRADPSSANLRLRTPTHMAAAAGSVQCLEAIMFRTGPGGFLAVDDEGHTPLWFASSRGHFDATAFFVWVNCPSVTDDQSSTSWKFSSSASQGRGVGRRWSSPLEAALDRCHVNVVRVLVSAGLANRSAIADWLVGVRERSGVWLVEYADFIDWLELFVNTPSRLDHLCRLVIRRRLETRVREVVADLPLPKKLKEFILLEDLIDKSIFSQQT